MGIELTNEQVYCIYSLENWWNSKDKQVFEISGPAGTGKALLNSTIIPTPSGNKEIGNIKEGDYVFNRKGKAVKVLGVYPQGKKKVYQIRFDDGSVVKCNDEHIWTYMKPLMPLGYTLESKTLKEIMEDASKNIIPNICNGYRMEESMDFRFKIPLPEPVEYDKKDYSNINCFGMNEPYDIGKFIGSHLIKNTDKVQFIPQIYMEGSINQRISLLKGLSYYAHFIDDYMGCITFRGTNYNLLMSIKILLASLGIKSIITHNSVVDKNKKQKNIQYLQVMCNKKDINLFTSDKNLIESASKGKFKNTNFIGIASIEPLNTEEDMTCIYVDDDEHLFLCSPFFIPTHNTTIVKYFIERLGLSYDKVLFCSFSGKAATQLARNGLPAKTIHSAIYDYEEKIVRDEKGKVVFDDRGKIKLKKEFVLKPHLQKKIKLIVVDEASMVNEQVGKDLLSYGIPVVTLGDLNQLPPVFGSPFFLVKPDFELHQVMRQAEDSPIIYLSQKVLHGEDLRFGVYGTSFVVPKKDLSDYHLKQADMIITCTNKLRYNINNYCRENIKHIKKLEYPHINEKVICRKNNWDMCLDKNIYMTNGMTGFVDYVYRDSYNKRTMKMDFRPDFMKKSFKKVEFDYKHMYANPSDESNSPSWFYDKFEFAYAITDFSSQGSEWPFVLYMYEDFYKSEEDRRKHLYTAITRARESIGIIL